MPLNLLLTKTHLWKRRGAEEGDDPDNEDEDNTVAKEELNTKENE